MNNLILPIILAMLAGFSNGAYLSPLKKGDYSETKLQNSYSWVFFSLFTFLIFPMLTLCYTLFMTSFHLPLHYLLYIILTGLVYGTGMYFLTRSVEYIGLGVPFAISIAMGTLSGSLFSVIVSGHFEKFVSTLSLVSYAIFIISIILYAIALLYRDRSNNKKWLEGLLLCIISSVLCATQGACLGFFADYFKAQNDGFLGQIFPWTVIFISCSTIFIFLHLRSIKKAPQQVSVNKLAVFKASSAMIFLYSTSIVLYTTAINQTGGYSETYLWVIFMGCIILSSTVCSYLKKEWKNAPQKSNLFNFIGIALLITSLLLLSAGKA